MKFRDIFDVSKGNGLEPVTIVLSSPLVAITVALWMISIPFFMVACIVGRRAAFNVLYNTAVKLGMRES